YLAPDSFYQDVAEGLKRAPMALRISPYLLSLIDWQEPYSDPIRTQFLPLASQQRPDHPALRFDSLHEQKDSPVPGLTHRYPDKAPAPMTKVTGNNSKRTEYTETPISY